ncbi:hypothetical protein GQX73_g1509 [Xylaria multiplex]|uniref:Uncharacterized protein n=1 Tax=Xylaria multiplex TaxID=323545 RepID=A0A7C8IWT2_9PEZI|nr:hypothetical protein GQX73_g1509 [Xylaria multiplex]
MSNSRAFPLADLDLDTARLLPCRQRRRRVRIQGQLAIVRTVSIANLQQAKNGSPITHINTNHKEALDSPLGRQYSYDDSEVEDGDDDVASHMAEALSVAASGIAVAQVSVQVGKSIIKLKQLWDEIQDVPSTIGDLLDQIECLDPALWEADNTFSQASLPPIFWDNSLASRSTAYCRKALCSLTELVDELALQINRPGKIISKLAYAKVVLKKEQLKSLERRLQNAVRMLTLAQQSYLVALTRIQPDIIIQRFTAMITPPPLAAQTVHSTSAPQLGRLGSINTHRVQPPSRATKPADDEDSEGHALTQRQRPKRQDFGNIFRFRLPFWLSRTTWELQSSRSYGNWKLNLRCYSVVPRDSEVIKIAQHGAPRDLEMLCAHGLASPYDRDDYYGDTLLHLAMWGNNKPMVRHLLDIGLSPSELNDNDGAPIKMVIYGHLYTRTSFLTNWSSNELEILTDPLDTYFDPKGETCSCALSLVSRDVKKIYQVVECPSHETTTLKSRLKQLFYHVNVVEDPMAIPDFLQPYWSQDFRALRTASIGTFDLLHVIAIGFGSSNYEFTGGWALLADMVVCNTPDIHQITNFGTRDWLPRPSVWTLVSNHLKLWLSKIRSNGYDLKEYGRRENELLANKDLILGSCLLISRREAETYRRYDIAWLRGYEYGPEPEDWKVLVSFPEKSYAADFWNLVEDGPQVVPGSWVEDDDGAEGYTWDQLSSIRRGIQRGLGTLEDADLELLEMLGL